MFLMVKLNSSRISLLTRRIMGDSLTLNSLDVKICLNFLIEMVLLTPEEVVDIKEDKATSVEVKEEEEDETLVEVKEVVVDNNQEVGIEDLELHQCLLETCHSKLLTRT